MSPYILQKSPLFLDRSNYDFVKKMVTFVKIMVTFVKIMVTFIKIMMTFVKEWRHSKCHHFGIRSFNVEFSHAREMKEERIHELTYRPF